MPYFQEKEVHMSDAIFNNKRLDPEKLLLFGFTKDGNEYTYVADIVDGRFRMTVTVLNDGMVITHVADPSSNKEYLLHRTPGAGGLLAEVVRFEHERVLSEIAGSCFEQDVFESDQAQRIIRYVRDTYHDELEFLWERSPDNAIFRRKDTDKWYGALLVLSKRKLGIGSDEVIDVMDLRMRTEDIEILVDRKKYFPGFHMNKKHWISICLDGSVQIDEIFKLIDESYELAVK